MSVDQYTMRDPKTMYPRPKFPMQPQGKPGLAKKMEPKPDHGETRYKGSGRLKGRKAIVTGADSGIGRATAIAFAREGADLMLSYLPEEEPDAKEVIGLVTKEGRKVLAAPGDLSSKQACEELISKAVDELDGLDLLAIVAGWQVAIDDIEKLATECHIIKVLE